MSLAKFAELLADPTFAPNAIRDGCREVMSLLWEPVRLGDLGNFVVEVSDVKDVFAIVPYDSCHEFFFTLSSVGKLRVDVKDNIVEIEAMPTVVSYRATGPLNLWKLYVLYFIYSRIDRNLICNNSATLCRLFERVDAALREDPPKVDVATLAAFLQYRCRGRTSLYINMMYVRHVAKKIEEIVKSFVGQ